MDIKTKQKWVKALRSGEYKQGTGQLRNSKAEYCCLGVLCDLVEPNQWHRDANGRGDEADTGMPRSALQQKFGLNKPCSRSSANTIADKLASMNDNGKSFEEIANWIERRKF